MTLTRQNLDNMGCGIENCTHDHSTLFIHGACHPHAPVEAAYYKPTGTLVFRCDRCKTFISEIQVATGMVN